MGQHNEVGALGEYLTATHLAQAGPVTAGRADMCFAGTVEVEVKTSRVTKYNGNGGYGYQFLLEKRGHTSVRHADVVILICLDDALEPVASYVIPVWRLKTRTKITIPVSFISPFSMFRDAWCVVAAAYDDKKGVGDGH